MTGDPHNTSPSNLPPNYNTNDTFLCGVSYPSSEPLEHLLICCTEPIEISNDCFQYCPPSGRESTIFSNCLEAHVTTLDETGYKVYCNAGTDVDAVEAESKAVGGKEGVRGWKVLVGLGALIMWWGVLV